MTPPLSSNIPDLTGASVARGRYELTRLIGCGAFGKVYQALDTYAWPAELVAVKCQQYLESSTPLGQLTDLEFDAHEALSHGDRIVGLRHLFLSDDGELLFSVMDYCPGGDLSEAVHNGSLVGKPRLVKRIMRQLLDGVEFMHKKRIYHRDLKPENILMSSEKDDPELDIKIADFGLATRCNWNGQFGTGTKTYMSPENVDKSLADGIYKAADTDLWACAVIFVILATSHFPWARAHKLDKRYAEYREDPNYLHESLHLTQETSDLVDWCFTEDPAGRPTLDAFRRELDKIDEFVTAVVRKPDPSPSQSSRAESVPAPPSPPSVQPSSMIICDCSGACPPAVPPRPPIRIDCGMDVVRLYADDVSLADSPMEDSSQMYSPLCDTPDVSMPPSDGSSCSPSPSTSAIVTPPDSHASLAVYGVVNVAPGKQPVCTALPEEAVTLPDWGPRRMMALGSCEFRLF
ncbi:unnamed protein product [Mycena citricolor]|uniref:non-specific serine/threonine protein kinase n=1 Tax=Mycena citricolor TaxID=2018698 RepID=A0AAD2JXZ6_9AGAR|nr:unnamed protein product [Mycena citricolor]